MTEREFVVPATLVGERVDRALALLTGWSRADVVLLVEQGSVLVTSKRVQKSRRLEEGEVISVISEPVPPSLPEAESMDLTVVFEDADLIVIDKPTRLVVHPGAGNPTGTLVNGLLARYPELSSVGDVLRPGIVHRLDRDTSGLMLVARSQAAYEALTEALAQRQVERRYQVLIWGIPDSPTGVIDAPIGRSVRMPTRMAVREGGKYARTSYEVLEEFPEQGVALMRCSLETGRTHQIRVHVTAIGHPVVGDKIYGGIRDPLRASRLFLHAEELAFSHPITGESQRFESALPDDLQGVLDGLKH